MDERVTMLRVPQHIRDGIEFAARKNNRTFAQQARHVLERYVVQNQIKQSS